MMHLAIARQTTDFACVRDDIDQFVGELEMEMLKLCGQSPDARHSPDAHHSSQNSHYHSTYSVFDPEPVDITEIRSLTSGGGRLSQSSDDSAITSSTVYNDFEEDLNAFNFSQGDQNSKRATRVLLESALRDSTSTKELSPSEISTFCSNIANMRHANLTVHSTLAGKVVPEMSPEHGHPALILECQLGAWKWYVCKSAQQIKAFDKVIRSWLDLEHIKLPRLPDMTPTTSPKQCHQNDRMLEEYIASVCAHLPRVNDHVLSAVARFVETTPIVPSPIFHSSCFALFKGTVGYKVRFCVFNNGFLQVFDGPGGKPLKRISLYLSSVQMAEQRNTVTIREFDSKATKLRDHIIISFENDLVCNKWLQMLQGATHTKVPYSHNVAALPYTLTSWEAEAL